MERILVRATNWVGDAVMSVPALQALRERYPRAHIAVLARPWVADLYAREFFADQVIRFDAPRGLRGAPLWWSAAAKLRALSFDTAILFPNSFESAAIAALAGIQTRIGYNRDGRGWLLTRAILPPQPGETPAHQRFYYLELLRRAGILDTLPAAEAIRLGGASAAATAGRERLAQLGWTDVVGVSPGAAYGGAKRWHPERFAEAAASFGWPVAVFGAPEEREIAEGVARHLHLRGAAVHNFAGQTTLREFIDLAAACRVFLTNDSGPMHIASALGVPTVAVFGATDHNATGPTGPLARVVREPVACSPCLLRECPIDHRCMTAVTATRVAETGLDLLK
jgi:heptosyltransferase-2